MIRALALSATICFLGLPAAAQAPCGGDFGSFLTELKAEAIAAGQDSEQVNRFFESVRQDPKVLQADAAQGIFQMPFLDFSRRLISSYRLQTGAEMAKRHADTFARVEEIYGVPKGVLLAFWALETDFGAVQGDFNTANALVTLAHDCRRPYLFRPQALAAIELYARGDLDPALTTGAWAGEIGMVQMLPGDILAHGVDGDGDGHVRLKTSVPDALMSGGALLQSLGWQAGQPWLREVTVPEDFEWHLSGLEQTRPQSEWQAMGVLPREGSTSDLPASLLLPQGRKGPAFLAYPNFRVFFEWNQSFVYVTTAAYFSTRLSGAPIYLAGNPDPGLDDAQMRRLQQRLTELGHDVGGIDGILGARTRAAVQFEQNRLGLPADAWPTSALLDAL